MSLRATSTARATTTRARAPAATASARAGRGATATFRARPHPATSIATAIPAAGPAPTASAAADAVGAALFAARSRHATWIAQATTPNVRARARTAPAAAVPTAIATSFAPITTATWSAKPGRRARSRARMGRRECKVAPSTLAPRASRHSARTERSPVASRVASPQSKSFLTSRLPVNPGPEITGDYGRSTLAGRRRAVSVPDWSATRSRAMPISTRFTVSLFATFASSVYAA